MEYRTMTGFRRPAGRTLFPASILFALLLSLSGCSPRQHEVVVATVGTDAVPLTEFERMYLKSSGSREIAEKSSLEERERFLDLIVKYRLKLADAYRSGLDRRPDVIGELDQYRGSLASSFLMDREVVQPGIRSLYARRMEEIRASHILLELSPTASAEDSAAAYKQAQEIIAQAKAGTDFGILASQLSKDPSAARNQGDLYFFTAGQMVPPFEEAAYTTKVGEYNTVRTQYGLHILKVTDRKPAPGEVHAGHIMIRFPSATPSPEDTAQAYARIVAIRDSLRAGTDFGDLATRNSEDPGSAARSGDLGWFTRRRWILPFDEVAMAMQPGQVSDIVRTAYGYHIIKCYERRPPKTLDEMRQELQQLYQQQRFQDDYRAYVSSLKREVGLRTDSTVVSQFLASLDSTKTTRDTAWTATIPPSLRVATMMTVGTRRVTVDSVLSLMKGRQDLANTSLRAGPMRGALEKIEESLTFTAKADLLEKQNPEFAALLQEYKEGILLYQVEQDNVWGKVSTSDSLLRSYYETNPDRFVYPDRVRFTEIRAATDLGARTITSKLNAGMTPEAIAAEDSARLAQPARYNAGFKKGSTRITPSAAQAGSSAVAQMMADSLLTLRLVARPDTSKRKSTQIATAEKQVKAMADWIRKRLDVPDARISTAVMPQNTPGRGDTVIIEIAGRTPRVNGKVEYHLMAPSADERARRADSLLVGAHSAPFSYKNAFSIVRLDGREPARRKTFEEAAPEVSTAFQEYESKRLESEWINRLRTEFPVTEYPEELPKAFAPVQ